MWTRLKYIITELLPIVISGLLAIYCAVSAAFLPILWLNYHGDQEYISTLEKMEKYQRTQADYWFNGANDRGLVDICKFEDGEIRVIFKDECEDQK